MNPIADYLEDVYREVVLGNIIGLLLDLTGKLTGLLAYTPVEVWAGIGFQHVYSRVAFAALISIAVIWALAYLRVTWGVTEPESFHGVVVRTAASLVVVQVAPVVLTTFATIANRFTAVFAADYQKVDVAVFLQGTTRDIEIGILLMVVIVLYYLIRLLLQFAWRIGAITLAHAFLPIFAVLWILPSQHNTLAQVSRSVMSLLAVQVAHTLEMWAFTWVTLSMGDADLWLRMLLQIGILQVMVSTPGYVLSKMGAWVEHPQTVGREFLRMVTMSPVRNSWTWRRLRRLIPSGR